MANTKQVAKVALFNESGEVLILTRSATDVTRPGRFDFPGGGIDPGENPLQAVLREIEEEIGLKLSEQDMRLLYASTDWYDNQSTTRFLFVGVITSDKPLQLSYEHSAHQWMSPEGAIERYDHPVWIEGLKYIRTHNLL